MQDIFMQSQWDTLLAYLREGRPPTWQLLALVNGGFVFLWLYLRWKGRKLNPATLNLLRLMFIILNSAVVFREGTLNLMRPFVKYFY